MLRHYLGATLFPSTTLFRSVVPHGYAVCLQDLRDRYRSEGTREYFHTVTPHEGEDGRSEEHTSELQSHSDIVCRLLLEKKKCRRPRRRKFGRKGQHKIAGNI